MEKRKLGRTSIEVTAIGLGCMSMSGVYGNASDEESISVIHHALERGIYSRQAAPEPVSRTVITP